jgi:hypothetical protein
MCTVSFINRKNGYALAMNRDENLTRVMGLPPKLHQVSGRTVLCPSEPGGGTWIAVNDTGATLALINWYAIKAKVEVHAVSRGEVVNSVGAAEGKDYVDSALAALPLAKMNPFRLIGIFPSTGEIFEWRWDLKNLISKRRSWKPQQWISSGFDEPKAQRIRSATFRQKQSRCPSGSLDWLRRLHRSHAPECGAFSTCMHRPGAITVSCTEIALTSHYATMRYCPGSPCRALEHYVCRVRLQRNQSRARFSRFISRDSPVD